MPRKRKSIEDKFWPKVQIHIPNGCWLWIGSKDRAGYGKISTQIDGATSVKFAHRIAYALICGPIPEGLVIDHLCRVVNCVNPFHMEPVTIGENVRRGRIYELNRKRGKIKRAASHCYNGHKYDDRNHYFNEIGTKICRVCSRNRVRKYRSKN